MQISNELQMTHQIVLQNPTDPHVAQERLESWCNKNNLDAVLISAQDAFLSEYTPSVPTNDSIFRDSRVQLETGSSSRVRLQTK